MTVMFWIAAAIAVFATGMVITRQRAIHALLYLVVSFLALALVFYALGAEFVAILEVIVYAGAIMVLFLFALMLIDPGRSEEARERKEMRPRAWIVPGMLCSVLLFEVIYMLARGGVQGSATGAAQVIDAASQVKAVGISLFGPYLLGVELASILLLAGLVATHRLTQHAEEDVDGADETDGAEGDVLRSEQGGQA